MNLHLPVPASNVAFTVFGLDIMWYGVLICIGASLAAYLACKRAPLYGYTSDDLLDIILLMLPLGIVGARLYYVVFNWSSYKDDLLSIFNTRGGGLAIHGGILFGLLGVFIMTRHKKKSFVKAIDCIIPTVALAQSIGRWGNYFNQEAHGVATDLPWGIWIEAEQQYVHPTFLYESIWCLLLAILLLTVVTKRQKFDGQLFLAYGILYSVERYFVEGLRTDSLYLGPYRQAQLLSLAVILLFSLLWYRGIRNHREEIK